MIITQINTIDIYVFFTITTLFIIALILKALLTKHSNIVEYLIAGRRLTLPIFTTTLIATWYSGIFGVTQVSFEHGIYNFITQGFFWYLAAACFAVFILKKARNTQAVTFAEIFKTNYGIYTGKITALLLLFKTLPIPYAISLGIFIQFLTGIDLNIGIMIGSTIVAIYCLKGGLNLTLYTDIAQFVLMFVAMFLIVYFSYNNFGGIDYLKANLPASHFTIKGNHNLSTVFIWIFVAFSSTLLSPVFYQRCFAAASYKVAKKGIFISIGFWFICDILTTLSGLYAKAHMPELMPADAFLTYSLHILPNGLKGFFLAAIAIVLFSALDSYLFITSSTFFYDILGARFKDSIRIRKISVIITAICTTILATLFRSIEEAWILTESVFLAAAFIPMLGMYFFKININDKVLASIMVISAASVLLWEIMKLSVIVDGFYVGTLINLCLIMYCKSFSKYQ